jgi:hypothetical protein
VAPIVLVHGLSSSRTLKPLIRALGTRRHVRPEHDHLVPDEWTKRVAKLIPDSELVVLPKAGHSIGPRTATRLTALLVPFLVEAADESDEEIAEPAVG